MSSCKKGEKKDGREAKSTNLFVELVKMVLGLVLGLDE